MQKILTIAAREYRAMVGTKAFAFSICMMPILMFGSILAMKFLKNAGSVQERKIVVIDHTGGMVPALRMAAQTHNATIDRSGEDEEEQEDEEGGDDFSFSKGSKYFLEEADASQVDDELRLEFCNRIRRQELYGLVEIPAQVHQIQPDGTLPKITFYSEDSGMSDSRRWLQRVLNERIQAMRLQSVGIDFSQVQLAQTPVDVRGLGLLERSADGTIVEGEEKDELTALFLPMIVMLLMFMVTFLASQPMLESVLEEKAQRIAEVLLGSANPSQLMAGKLLGTVGGSLTIFAIYTLGGFVVARSQGFDQSVPFGIVPWFVLFQVFGVMFFASIFMAVGSAVSQLKEAQSMLLPVWMVMMLPMFVWIFVVQEPNGALATWLSLFPPATPAMMVLRLATGATIPLWQPLLGLTLLVVATGLAVVVAGRIFRIGILWQGKTPKLSEICRWALSG